MPDTTLYSYMELSQKFPLPGKSSDVSWEDFVRRLRMKGKLVEGKHYVIKYRPMKSTQYNLRSLIQLICNEAKKDPPLPTAVYLVERYCSEFRLILTASRTTVTSSTDIDILS